MVRDDRISTLCNAIGVRLISHSMASLNTAFVQILLKGFGHVLPTLVIMQDLDLCTSRQFNSCLVRFERLWYLVLGSEEVEAPMMRKIVHKQAPVLVTIRRLSGHGTMYIRVHQHQRSILACRILVNNPPLVPSKAWFANRINRVVGSDGDPSDKAIGDHGLQFNMIEV